MATTIGPRIEKEPYLTSSPFEPVESPPSGINLSDHDLYVKWDFHTALRLLRDQSPIFWRTKGGAKAFGDKPYWAMSSHDGFTQIIRNQDVFSSVHPIMDRTSEAMGLRNLLFTMDGQEHKSYRAAVERYTDGKAINAAKEAIDKAIRADFAESANNGGTDMAPLCCYAQGSVAFAFNGFEDEEAERLRDIFRGLVSSRLSPTASGEYITDEGMTELIALVEDILAESRENPRDEGRTWFLCLPWASLVQ